MMSDDYRIEKTRRRVEVTLANAKRLDGDVLLVQKAQIAVACTELPEVDDSVERGVVGMHVELGLIDGSTLSGSIFPEVRMGRPRLVDILNDSKQPFIALFGADQLQIVNRALIAHARPLS